MIIISNLTKRFGELIAVDGLNLEIGQDGIFGLLGPNGAGKTTTINMICGLLPPTSGSIHFEGFGRKDTKLLIGYCPQENIFYPRLSCLEQLHFIGRMYGMSSKSLHTRADELLELLGLQEKRHARASKLSGGMKRRLNIALALIHDPEIIILDEPEAGLDPQSRILVRDFIKNIGHQKTVILTTHNMDEADRLSSRIALIDYGKLLLIDTPRNLKKTIGEGDILELVPEAMNESAVDTYIQKLENASLNVTRGTDSLLIKHPEIVEQLPEIKKMADSSAIRVAEIRLRENTLEDVFIHLTGRKLRQ